jgi:hypothetical protein
MEYAFVIRTTAVIAGDLEWLAYAFLVVIAFHHTDSVARMRHLGRGPARWVYSGAWLRRADAGPAALALTGSEACRRGLPIIVGLLAVVYITECAICWIRPSIPADSYAYSYAACARRPRVDESASREHRRGCDHRPSLTSELASS